MMDQTTLNRLKDNWQQVQCDVSEAMDQCGRDPESVTIVGVSKYVDAELTKALYQAGCANLGESRPQSLWTKAEALSECDEVRWHMIGHLQRNKIRRVLSLASSMLIHSVDSERLFDALADESKRQEGTTSALLEVNIAHDESKSAMDSAACIGCGACVAVCKNSSAALFLSAKVSHLVKLPQGKLERAERVISMVNEHDDQGFGSCTNTGACAIVCPQEIPLIDIARMNYEYNRSKTLLG